MQPDLDLALVRSFVATADELHFGIAADELQITQQALSKRIRKLESALELPLFVRTTRRVLLSPVGEQFLPLARELLASADAAVQALRQAAPPLRVDVLDDRLAPMKLLTRALAAQPSLRVEASARRGVLAALAAVERGEIDVAFGRCCDLDRPWPAALTRRVVRLEPLEALVREDHPLARRDALTPEDLRRCGVWVPDSGSTVEWGVYLRRWAHEFGLPLDFEEPAASLAGLVERLRAEPARVCLTGADVPWPVGSGLRALPIADPVPVYPWALIRPRHSLAADRFAATVTRVGRSLDRATAGPTWMPEPDRDLLDADLLDADLLDADLLDADLLDADRPTPARTTARPVRGPRGPRTAG